MTRVREKRRPDMPKADFITSLVLLGFSVAAVLLSLRLPRLEHRGINEWTVPGLVPGLIGVVIGLLALTLLARSLRYGGARLGLTKERVGEFIALTQVRRATATTALCLFYAMVLIGLVPYVLGTFLFMFGFILLFEYDPHRSLREQKRTFVVAAVEAVIVSAAVASLFQYVFLVRLP
ncbi:MAG: tripartite tricarboxylate transporter TctB family protein [Spirochaetaceae bacterium]